MATLESLVNTIAEVECIGVERVRAIARAMREAALITMRGRGRSAAKMTTRDAANLLIAVNVADTARTAPEMVKLYRGLVAKDKMNDITNFGREFEYVLRAARTEEMAVCIEYYARCWLAPSLPLSNEPGLPPYAIHIAFEKPIPNVAIHITGPDETTVLIPFSRSGRGYDANLDGRQTITISGKTVFAVGDLLDGRSTTSRRANPER